MSSIPPNPPTGPGPDDTSQPHEQGAWGDPGDPRPADPWSAPAPAGSSVPQESPYAQGSPAPGGSPYQQGPSVPPGSPAGPASSAEGGQGYGARDPGPDASAPGAGPGYGAPGQGSGYAAPAYTAPPTPARGVDVGADLGASVKWAWNAFTRTIGPFVVPAVVYSVVTTVVVVVGVFGIIAALGVFSLDTYDAYGSPRITGGQVGWAIGIGAAITVIAAVCSLLWLTGATRAGAEVIDGRHPSIGQGFTGTGRTIGTALVVVVLTSIGSILFIIPGVVLSVVLMYAVPASARGASLGEAFSQSWNTVKTHPGTSILAALIVYAASALISTVSSIVIVTGVLVILLVPLQQLLYLALFERLNGRELSEPARA